MAYNRQMFWFWLIVLMMFCIAIFIVVYTLMREEQANYGIPAALLLRWRQ
jgi:hypothetical protein